TQPSKLRKLRDEDGGGSRQPSWWRGCASVNCGGDDVAIVVDDRCGDEVDGGVDDGSGWEVMVWWVLVDDVCGDDDMEMKVGGGVACRCGRRQVAGKWRRRPNEREDEVVVMG
ncbi:hypothetical protein Tco_1171467, partial [Tanacetum coccineum]